MTTTTSKEVLRQVLLRKPSESGGYNEDVFWIDNKLAKVGKKVVGEDGVVWQIAELYGAREFSDLEIQRGTWKRFADILEDH